MFSFAVFFVNGLVMSLLWASVAKVSFAVTMLYHTIDYATLLLDNLHKFVYPSRRWRHSFGPVLATLVSAILGTEVIFWLLPRFFSATTAITRILIRGCTLPLLKYLWCVQNKTRKPLHLVPRTTHHSQTQTTHDTR